ncbi:elongation factor G-binding protein [Brevibacillus agri]|uniref:Elongation factor G-binding protein n=1 Tax=Brevibacillus agri TaxID=51101 RepID=A0A3M8B5R6_9BACL|nr:FusB/FusC family EF-G-binding protein [Brevibacillus agri]QAV13757.1 elongation factor G-binding protein [Brevibacillus agri]RNB58774.1 elongation factor G-binding protein [Brevibacillus agri]GED27302.1 elongation factor G-binding protein [Brevibacillus agri]
MQPFISPHHYHFIKAQVQTLLNAYTSSTDPNVIRARKEIAQESVFQLFPGMTEEQKQLLAPLAAIKEKNEAKQFLLRLSPYIIPFPALTEQAIKKMFPKVKKLKPPATAEIPYAETSYVSWFDSGADKKYIIAYYPDKLIGIHGVFTPLPKKGICAICNKITDIGMFVLEARGAGNGTYLKKGNYLCQDSVTCNQNIRSLEKLHDFLATMVK